MFYEIVFRSMPTTHFSMKWHAYLNINFSALLPKLLGQSNNSGAVKEERVGGEERVDYHSKIL